MQSWLKKEQQYSSGQLLVSNSNTSQIKEAREPGFFSLKINNL